MNEQGGRERRIGLICARYDVKNLDSKGARCVKRRDEQVETMRNHEHTSWRPESSMKAVSSMRRKGEKRWTNRSGRRLDDFEPLNEEGRER